MTIDDRITALIQREGGFVNNPEDAGGPTKFGITLISLIRVISVPSPPGLNSPPQWPS